MFLTPEIDREIDQGKGPTPRKDFKIDQEKVFGINYRFLEKSQKMVQKDEEKIWKKSRYIL